MPFFAPNDRRQHPRANLAAPCPCFFRAHGKRVPAFMVDVSAGGVGFRNYELAAPVDFLDGQKIKFDVVTPYGRGTYNGSVAWVSSMQAGQGWGLKLEEPLAQKDGVLGQLLNAAFPAN